MNNDETHLTHFNQQGEAHMVDIGNKDITKRIAVTEGKISMQDETLKHILAGNNKKGDVLGIARVAGIMASKKTPELIPLCHPLSLTHVEIELIAINNPASVYCKTTVATDGKTGVEMEALNATQVALLTIYDMCKAVDKGMIIDGVRLLKKSGGKTGEWNAES
ncbi:UNVERIFIED_CONTAM: hypothetical protein GTU68_056931 [Idotea baltica]|nr:hypothetical protein [Idotea baltica]